ncbi:MAG: hypothetical protein K6F58_06885 [Bacteroidales bacterium]|nr:hypothetical protein [Bacteroidales bacterium]
MNTRFFSAVLAAACLLLSSCRGRGIDLQAHRGGAGRMPENVAYCHSLGIKVVPWTVDEPEDILRMAAGSVDAIISNYPDRLIELLR